jgi:hypothetical protein
VTEGKIAVDEDRSTPVFSPYAGRVTKLKFNTGSGINTYNLQGAGLWVGSSLPNRWGQAQWRMTWAHRIGTNPAAQANGLDLDGTLHNDRFWLSVIQQF